jgi:hypothetical protein
VHMRKTTTAALQQKYLQSVLTFRIGLVYTGALCHSVLWTLLFLFPAKLRGSQNKFPSLPFPFETRCGSITACPANIAAISPSVFDVVLFRINKANHHHSSLQPRFESD